MGGKPLHPTQLPTFHLFIFTQSQHFLFVRNLFCICVAILVIIGTQLRVLLGFNVLFLLETILQTLWVRISFHHLSITCISFRFSSFIFVTHIALEFYAVLVFPSVPSHYSQFLFFPFHVYLLLALIECLLSPCIYYSVVTLFTSLILYLRMLVRNCLNEV